MGIGALVGVNRSARKAGDKAAKGIRRAAGEQVAYQREALEYLKEVDSLPRQYREQAQTQLAGRAGLMGLEEQQVGIDQTRESPFYQALLDEGEESALRNSSATGLLRSGNAISEVGDAARNAFLTTYNQQQNQLQGLSGLPSMAPSIANATQGIGQTLGQAGVAATQAKVTGKQQGFSNMMALLGTGLQGTSAFSDIRLKENVKPLRTENGINFYSWTWNKEASKLGLYGDDVGVMAHEVFKSHPQAIGDKDGYITVDMDQLKIKAVA